MPGGLGRMMEMAENGGRLPQRQPMQTPNAKNERLWVLPRFKVEPRQIVFGLARNDAGEWTKKVQATQTNNGHYVGGPLKGKGPTNAEHARFFREMDMVDGLNLV